MYKHSTPHYTARDLATPRRVCRSPYCRGFEDALYGRVYYCVHPAGSDDADSYERGHQDGMAARAQGWM